MLDELRRLNEEVKALPPMPHVIRAHHSVPYGRAFRQWDTAGRLIVWANRGEIADLPRSAPAALPGAAVAPYFGIPVVIE